MKNAKRDTQFLSNSFSVSLSLNWWTYTWIIFMTYKLIGIPEIYSRYAKFHDVTMTQDDPGDT
jgi:hypothetical protein